MKLLLRVVRYALLLFLLLVTWMYLNPSGKAVGNSELRILSYNVFGLSGEWAQGNVVDLLGGISNVDCDILFLQEFPAMLDHGLVARMFREKLDLPNWQFFPYEKDGRVGMAILTRYPIIEQEFISLPPKSEGRGVGCVHIDVDGRPLELSVVHMPNTDIHRDGGRASLTREIFGPNLRTIHVDGLLANRKAGEIPQILAGDFNTFTLSAAWRKMRGHYHDAFQFPEMFYGTFKLKQDIEVKIDHIFVSSTVEVLDAEVLNIMGSDHRPVYARIRF